MVLHKLMKAFAGSNIQEEIYKMYIEYDIKYNTFLLRLENRKIISKMRITTENCSIF